MYLTNDSAIRTWPAGRSARATARVKPVERFGGSGPLVSILIPAHNAEESMRDTLHSALAQTWQYKEIIVVDDGSTDRTASIVREFEPHGVRLVTQEKQGAAAARNRAFSLCHGDYIQWLDADDLLAPNKITAQLAVLRECQSNRTLVSSAWGKFLYRYYRAKFTPTGLWCDLSPLEWLLRKMGQNVYMQTGAWLVSRELTEAAGPWDTRLSTDDDGEYFCRVLLASDGVRFVPQAKLFYRTPGFRSLSYIGSSNAKRHALWLSMRLHIKYLRSLEDSDRVRRACLQYLQTSWMQFYPDQVEIVNEAKELARELGGDLSRPTISWKYSWIKALFGWEFAKRSQRLVRGLKWWAKRQWDKALFFLENPAGRRIRDLQGEV